MSKNNNSKILILSYFDQVEGPRIFYSNSKFKPLTNDLLDLIIVSCNKENPLPIAFEKFQSMSYLFHIYSKFARGKKEEFLITYVINQPFAENLRSLKFKTPILKEFAHELKTLKELPRILNEKRKNKEQLEVLWSNKFKKAFLEIYNRYESILALSATGKPQNHDILTLKINIKPEILIYIINSIFFRRRILILIEKNASFLVPIISNFVEFIFRRSFTGDILFKAKAQYNEKHNLYKEYLVLNEKQIVNETRQLLGTNHLKYEREIIRTFYRDNNSSVDNIEEKLKGIYMLARQVFSFFDKYENMRPLSPKEVAKYLETTLSVKNIKRDFILYLADIVRAYFGSNFIWRSQDIGDKIDAMWPEV